MQIESVRGNASVVAVFEIGTDPGRGTGVEVQVPDAVDFFEHDGNNKNGLTWASLILVQGCLTHYGASVPCNRTCAAFTGICPCEAGTKRIRRNEKRELEIQIASFSS